MKPERLNALFASNLRKLRQQRGWSQAELARRLSEGRDEVVHVPYISDLERGKKTPTFETMARLSEVLGVEPSDLIDESTEKNLAVA